VPFRIGNYVEAYPEVGWHQTFYDSHFQGSAERHLLAARLDLRTRLVRAFGGLTHLIEPRIGYALITDLGQDQWDDPMFVPKTAVPQRRIRQLALSNVTLDPADRVDEFNGITFGVGNRIYDSSGLVADFYLSNEFRINGSEFGNIFLGGRAYPFERMQLWANLGFDPEATKISEVLLQVAYASREGHGLRLSYRYLRDIPSFFEDFEDSSERFNDFTEEFDRVHQITFAGRYAITPQWSVHNNVAYSFEDSVLLAIRSGVEYVSKCDCWAAGFEFGTSRSRGFRFSLIYRLLGMGKQLERGAGANFGLLDGF
jgi:lipopolysaccharide assembly outer membrane protein LptD (OstA)